MYWFSVDKMLTDSYNFWQNNLCNYATAINMTTTTRAWKQFEVPLDLSKNHQNKANQNSKSPRFSHNFIIKYWLTLIFHWHTLK